MKPLRKKYSKVFKLLRLAVKNSNEGEAQAAIKAAQKLIAQLDSDLEKRLQRDETEERHMDEYDREQAEDDDRIENDRILSAAGR